MARIQILGMFLTWENVVGGANLCEGHNSPQKTGFDGGGGGEKKKGRMDSRWRRAGHSRKNHSLSESIEKLLRMAGVKGGW